jgi:hypothetical protein
MATKKKTKKQTKSKRTAGNKWTPMKKTAKKKLAVKRKIPKKELAEKAAQKKATVKTKADKKTLGVKAATTPKKRLRAKRQSVDMAAFSPEESGARSGQSGDLQGLSNVQGADSESVDELLEEGNAFEADVVKGVEDAGGVDEREVRTHEVPEDDVPEEYLDKE